MVIVRKLLWDFWNVHHIVRHHVAPEEVEAVCHGSPVVLRGQQKSRLVLIGKTEEERILAVVLESKGHGRYYPIAAFPAGTHDIALYHRLRGGENNGG